MINEKVFTELRKLRNFVQNVAEDNKIDDKVFAQMTFDHIHSKLNEIIMKYDTKTYSK